VVLFLDESYDPGPETLDVPSALKEVIEQIDDLAFLKKLHRQAITIGSLTAFEQALAN
jgi:hypothetical protein